MNNTLLTNIIMINTSNENNAVNQTIHPDIGLSPDRRQANVETMLTLCSLDT